MITATLYGYEAEMKNHPTGSLLGIKTIVSFNDNASEVLRDLPEKLGFHLERLLPYTNLNEALVIVSRMDSPIKAISLRKKPIIVI